MGKGRLKVRPELTEVLGAISGLQWDEKMSGSDPRMKTEQLIIDINDALDYGVATRAEYL